jgi:Bacterial Ig domain
MRVRAPLSIALMALLCAAAPVHAATLTVTGTGDTPTGQGVCTGNECPSIRAALEKAGPLAGPDTIVVPAGGYQLSAGELYVDSDVTIVGASAGATVVRGGSTFRVFEIASGYVATISRLTMRDGTATPDTNFFGGNLTNHGTLTLDHVRITNGSGYSAGGAANRGGTMTILNSLIDNNRALNGGGDAGALLNFGGDGPAATLVVRDTTIAFNSARLTAGVLEYGNDADSTRLERVTVAYNQSGDRGGGAIAGSFAFHVAGSIVAWNTTQGNPSNCGGGVTNDGGNLETGEGCGFDLSNIDPLLADTLGDAGGETQALAIARSSPAVDAAGQCTGTDQRDVPRPQGAACDAGAIELDTVAPDAPVITSADGGMLTGTAEPLATIEILDNGIAIGTTTAGSDGTWRFPISASGRHTYTAQATDAAGNTSPPSAPRTVGAEIAQVTPTPTPTPTPEARKTVVVQPVRGTVLVKRPGKGFVELDATQAIPVGSTIDTKNGTISLTSTDGTATFRDGIFKLTQTRTTTDLTLTEPLARCPRAGAAAAKKKPKTRKLWGNGSGSFRTRGQYSAATVRGTEWLVQDSCSGTLTRVRRGVVAVRDNVKGKTIVLRAGKRYLARPRR